MLKLNNGKQYHADINTKKAGMMDCINIKHGLHNKENY